MTAAIIFLFTGSLLNIRRVAVIGGFSALAAAAWWLAARLKRRNQQRNDRTFWGHGDRDAWPFLTLAEYRAADAYNIRLTVSTIVTEEPP